MNFVPTFLTAVTVMGIASSRCLAGTQIDFPVASSIKKYIMLSLQYSDYHLYEFCKISQARVILFFMLYICI